MTHQRGARRSARYRAVRAATTSLGERRSAARATGKERKMSEVLVGTVTDNLGLVINVWATEESGNTTFRIAVASGQADLRGFFFDYTGGAITTANTGVVTASYMGSSADGDDITKVGSPDNNMSGTGKVFDAGLQFRTAGVGKDDISTVTFKIDGLTLNEIDGLSFGIRADGVGAHRTGDVKLIGEFDVPNRAPVANNDNYTMAEDQILVSGVLANDTDADGNPLSAILVSGTAHGALTLNANGLFTYAPAANYNGSDSFTYKANDRTADSNVATVVINVTSVNDAPVGADNTVTTPEDTAYVFKVADFPFTDPNDSPANALAAVKISTLPSAAAGTLTDNGFAVTAGQSVSIADIIGSKLIFTPAANANGSPSFTFQVQDDGGIANGGVDLAQLPNTVTINVTPVNHAPVAINDSYTTAENTTLTVSATSVLNNDIDVDGNPLSAILVSGTAHGALTLNADGSFTYTPAANYIGSDSFTYKANDGTADSNVATADITVPSVNAAPVFDSGGTATIAEKLITQTVVYDAHATDAENDTLTYSLPTGVVDNDLFNINASTGEVTFKTSPNF